MEIFVKKLKENATIPSLGSEFAAGYDLYASESAVIDPGETKKIGTGIAVSIPDGYFGGVFARSGLAAKLGLRPANCVGVIDPDYRGEIAVALHNDSTGFREIKAGDRIAQLLIIPVVNPVFTETDELDETVRGEGGFGSTGTR